MQKQNSMQLATTDYEEEETVPETLTLGRWIFFNLVFARLDEDNNKLDEDHE